MPPLQKQTYRVNFGLGLDTKTDPKVLSSGQMVALKNARFVQINQVSKRNGFSAIGSPDSSGDSILVLNSFNSALWGIGVNPSTTNQRAIYSLNYNNDNNFDASFPSCNDFQVTSSALVSNQNSQMQGDVCYADGYTFYSWAENDGSNGYNQYWRLINTASGGVVNSGITAIGETFAYSNTPLSPLRCLGIPGSSFNFVATGCIGSQNGYNGLCVSSIQLNTVFQPWFNVYGIYGTAWDWISNNGNVYLVYQTGAKTFELVVTSGIFTGGTSVAYTSSVTITNLAIASTYSAASVTDMVVAYLGSDNKVYSVKYNTGLSVIASSSAATGLSTPTLISGQRLSGGAATIFVSGYSLTSSPSDIYGRIESHAVNSSGTIGAVVSTAYGAYIHSKPFYWNDGSLYFWSFYPSELQGQYILQNYANGAFYPAARILAGQGIQQTMGARPQSTVSTLSLTAGVFQSVATVIGQQDTDVGGFTQLPSLDLLTANNSFTNAYSAVTQNSQQVIAGGFNALYDGLSWSELGFFVYPEQYSATSSTTSTGLSIGTYQYVCTYEYIDNLGNLHRSQPGVALSYTTSHTSSVVLTIPCLRQTLKANATIGVYRSVVNSASGIFYKVNNLAAGALLNVVTQDTVTFTDAAPDTTITSNSILYTGGGVQPNWTPDGTAMIMAGPDRLLCADPNNNGVIHVGVPFVPTDGLAFLQGTTQLFPVNDGPFTAGLYMDSSYVLFKARSIYIFQGLGPTANGQNNQYTPPQLITDQVGCDGPKCAVLYPDGILFKSAKGYYRLGHDLSFSPTDNYVGKGVEAFNSYSCLRAALCADLNQARFLLSDNQTILCYDYFFKEWSTIVTSANDMTAVGGNFYLANATPANGALVGQETVGTFVDALYSNSTTYYPLLIKFGWIATNQLQGCQRIYRFRFVGDFLSSHTIQVTIGYDYESAATEVHTITSANITSNGSAYQFEIFPTRQKCEAIQIQIQDTSISGGSFDLTDMEVEVGIIPGRRFPLSSQKGA